WSKVTSRSCWSASNISSKAASACWSHCRLRRSRRGSVGKAMAAPRNQEIGGRTAAPSSYPRDPGAGTGMDPAPGEALTQRPGAVTMGTAGERGPRDHPDDERAHGEWIEGGCAHVGGGDDGRIPGDGATDSARRRRGRRGCPAEPVLRQDDDHDRVGTGGGD